MSSLSSVCKVKNVHPLNYASIRKIFYCSSHKKKIRVKINVQQIGMQQVLNSALQTFFILIIVGLLYFRLPKTTRHDGSAIQIVSIHVYIYKHYIYSYTYIHTYIEHEPPTALRALRNFNRCLEAPQTFAHNYSEMKWQ